MRQRLLHHFAAVAGCAAAVAASAAAAVLTYARRGCGIPAGLDHAVAAGAGHAPAAVLQLLRQVQPCRQAHAVLTLELTDMQTEAAVDAEQTAPGLQLLVVYQQEGCLLRSCADVQAQAAVQMQGQMMLQRVETAACHETAALLHVPGALALQD